MDELAKSLGFEDANEMNKLVSSVDFLCPDTYAAFLVWKSEDGTKTGLVSLLGLEEEEVP